MGTVTPIAAGVTQVTVGELFGSHVYLLDSVEGTVAFDAGIRGTGAEILDAAGGSLALVLLSHSHVDHRGAAPELGAPVWCHRDEVDDVQGDGGQRYIDFGLIQNEAVREALPRLNAEWDGGPVEVSDTVEHGDEVAGFRVIHAPGHAPGQIALYRASDRLLLAADAFYTVDAETGQPGSARVPHPSVNWDTEVARQSLRELAELDVASAWGGHSHPVEGDVATGLRAAADHPYG